MIVGFPAEIVRARPNGGVQRYGPALLRRLSAADGARVQSVSSGARGSLWVVVARDTGGPYLRHVTPSGRSRSFTVPRSARLISATASGPDGRLWFVAAPSTPTGTGRPGLFAARSSGRVARYGALPTAVTTSDLARGPKGTLWLTSGNRFWKISRNGRMRPLRLSAPVTPASLMVRVGNRMWVVDGGARRNALVDITPRGRVTVHVLGGVTEDDPDFGFGEDTGSIDLVSDGAASLWVAQPGQERVALVRTRPACSVPDLVGLTAAGARSALARAGCRARVRGDQRADGGEPQVVQQSHARNTIVARGSVVTATLGRQLPSCHMPLDALPVLDSDDAVVAARNLFGGRRWIACHKRVGRIVTAAPADEDCSGAGEFLVRDLRVAGTHVLMACGPANRYTGQTAVDMTWNDLTGAAQSRRVLVAEGEYLSVSHAATAGGDVAWLLSGNIAGASSRLISRLGLWRNGETRMLDEAAGSSEVSGRPLLADLRIDGEQVRWTNRGEQRSAPINLAPGP